MRASAWAVLLRGASSHSYPQPCKFCACRRRYPPPNQFHTSSRSRREDDQAESVPYQVHNDAQRSEEPSAEVEEIAEEGPGKPPRPKDKSNYGSAARRAGRNIKRVKELPPVHIPPWFLSRNVHLRNDKPQKAHSILEGDLWSHSSGIYGDDLSSHSTRSEDLTASEREGRNTTKRQPEAPDTGDQSASLVPHEASPESEGEMSNKPYRIDRDIWREIFSVAKAGLQIPSWQRVETVTSQKPHLLVYSPRDGSSASLNWLGCLLALGNSTDLLRLSPQDIAEIGGDYLDEPSEFRLNTISSLGYDAPLISDVRHAPPPEDPTEEEGYDEVEEEESSDHGGFKPAPFQRPAGGAFGGAAIHVGTFGGSIQDIFKSLIPAGSSPQAPKPVIMKPAEQQPRDMTPELKMGLLVETLLNSPEIKRVASSAANDAVPDFEKEKFSEDQVAKKEIAEGVPSEHQVSNIDHGTNGLIVLIKDYSQINATINGGKFLDKLHEVVENRRREGQRILIIGTESSQDLMPSLSKSSVKDAQNQPHSGPMRTIVVPAKEPFNGALELAHKINLRAINIRHIRDMLRRTAPDASQVAQVVVDWDLDIDSKIGFLSGLDESVWSMDRVNRIATTALGLLEQSEQLRSNHIERALELIESSDTAKVEWAQEEKERRKMKPTGSPNSDANVENTKERIRKLRKTCNDHEKKLLNGVVHPEDIRTTFTDVHAPPATIDALKTLTSLSLVRPDAFTYGVLATDRIPGLLMYGPPGTGKTLLARAVAKESGATVLEVSGSDVYDMYVGEGEKNVRAIFSLAKKLTPCIVFIDEADAILGARSGGSNRTSHRELINQFLREWDGMSEMSAFIMVATNRPFDLDEASLRRLPRRLLVDLPVEKDREAILKIHLKDELLSPDVSLPQLASQTPFYSGSDLKNVAVAAALACVREEFDAAAAYAKDTTNEETYKYPEKRTLHPRHFARAMEEISASISEDMGSLSAIRKFDEKYGDRRGRRKKGGYGFKTVDESEKMGSDAARVRNQT